MITGIVVALLLAVIVFQYMIIKIDKPVIKTQTIKLKILLTIIIKA